MVNRIAVLMAVHNGEKYLEDQIKSILSQTYSCFDLIIRDDGSSDGSVDIIEGYAKRDDRVIILRDDRKSKGAIKNFSILYESAREHYEYICFADQDDIWYIDKLELSLCAIGKAKDKPALVFTNMDLWKSSNGEIEPLYLRELTEADITFEHSVVQNLMYGCTMMLNHGLMNLIRDIPTGTENHDYWIAAVSTFLDDAVSIYIINERTLKHRLHMENATGRADARTIIGRLRAFKRVVFSRGTINEKFKVWECLRKELSDRYGDSIHLNNLDILCQSSGLLDTFRLMRIGFKGINWRSTIYFGLYVVFRKKSI